MRDHKAVMVKFPNVLRALGGRADVKNDVGALQDFADPAERCFWLSLSPWRALDQDLRSSRQRLRFR